MRGVAARDVSSTVRWRSCRLCRLLWVRWRSCRLCRPDPPVLGYPFTYPVDNRASHILLPPDTSSSSPVHQFYQTLSNSSLPRPLHCILMGDFNAYVGTEQEAPWLYPGGHNLADTPYRDGDTHIAHQPAACPSTTCHWPGPLPLEPTQSTWSSYPEWPVPARSTSPVYFPTALWLAANEYHHRLCQHHQSPYVFFSQEGPLQPCPYVSHSSPATSHLF